MASTSVDLALTTSESVLQIAKLLKGLQPSKSPLKSFYRHLIVHCVFVRDHVDRIESVLGPESELGTRVLDIFESLIAAEVQKATIQAYPRQRALNDRWSCLRSQSEDIRRNFASLCLVLEPASLLQDYEESFAAWQEDVISRYPEDGTPWSATPPRRSRIEPSYVVGAAARSLFEALERSIKCECSPAHELDAKLRLGTYRKPDLDDETDFDMFLTSNQDLQEVRAHIVRECVVRFVVSDEVRSPAPPKTLSFKPMAVKALCKQIEKMQKTASQRLELKVERGQLLKLRSEKSSFRIDKGFPPVPLQHIIRDGSRPLTEKTKRILAVLLSYAVLHLHGTPWIQSTWDSSQILFFQTPSSKIPLRPFVQAQLSGRQVATEFLPLDDDQGDLDPDDLQLHDLDPDDFQHPLPSLVTLAVILMELYFVTPFEVLASSRGIVLPRGIDSCTRFLDVASVFDEHKHEIPQNSQFYHAIETCLDPRIWQDEGGFMSDDVTLRAMVYQKIVRPLEDELCDAFNFITIEELDKIAETVDLGNWGQKIQIKQTERQVEQLFMPMVDGILPHRYQHLTTSRPISPQISGGFWGLNPMASHCPPLLARGQELTSATRYQTAEFYDDAKPSEAHSSTELQSYLNWKYKYEAVYNKYISPYMEHHSRSPVKIAVLDSGVDETHYALDTGQIKFRRNWTSKHTKATHDGDGHGTFTANLIMDYTPDAELYIAKIAEKAPCPPAVVAQAIKTCVDEWHVDVISMSFGYPTNQIDGYRELELALLHAHSNNVLMFAAASNSGANLDRAYPARDPHVICIHSTDSHGNRSRFSPTAVNHDANIATIGESIQSAWPVALCDTVANPDCVQCKSGTSYATPIAVGIAAFLLQYTRIHLAVVADLLKRQSKMKEVLLKIADKTQRSASRDDYCYVALSLFSDNLFGKDKQFIDATLEVLLKH